MFTLSKHGRPLDWAVVAQEVWRWPDSQVNVDADVWQACLHSLGLGPSKGRDTLRLGQQAFIGSMVQAQCLQKHSAAHAASMDAHRTCALL